jgi:hypothetical protein
MIVKIEVSKEVVVSLLNGEHVASGLLESLILDGINERNEGHESGCSDEVQTDYEEWADS